MQEFDLLNQEESEKLTNLTRNFKVTAIGLTFISLAAALLYIFE